MQKKKKRKSERNRCYPIIYYIILLSVRFDRVNRSNTYALIKLC